MHHTRLNVKEQLAALLKLGKSITAETDLDKILSILDDTARDILGADRCSIFIYDKSKDELWTKVAHGVDEIRVSAKKGVVGSAIYSKEVQIVVDAYADFRFNRDVDRETGYVTKSILAVPLLNSKGEAIGVFQAINKKDGVFSNIDAEILILIGNYASVSLENAILYNKLKNTQNKIINKIATAAEFKDKDTSRHTKRVGLYSYMLASKFGLEKDKCEIIKITAPMHDAGKIGIPDSIILKPAKLTDEEFSIMKRHCQIGFDLLYDEDDEVLQKAAIIAKEHHEKYNGLGYPLGLKGEEISIEGRIVSIADVFDALTSVRPYKKAWSLNDAREFLISNKAISFDPKLVDLFIENFDEVEHIYHKNQDEE